MKPLLLAILAVAPLCAQTVDVSTLGAKPDDVTDNYAIINKALSTAVPGSKIFFPCGPNGTGYLISQPLAIPGSLTLSGTHGYSCQIIYRSNTYNAAAFSLVNSKMVTIRDLGLYTSSQGIAPGSIVMLGGSHSANGQHLFDNVSIGGYASTALVYSIASENNNYRRMDFEMLGGTATIGFYTSAHDDLNLCPACTTASNLSVVMEGIVLKNNLTTPFTAFEDKTEGGTGDHVYRDGFLSIGQNPASAGFTFVSGDANHGGPNSRISVSGFRIAEGGYGFMFLKDYQGSIYDLDIHGNTWDSNVTGAVGFMQSQTGLMMTNCRFEQNLGENHSPVAVSFLDQIQNSVVMENYGPITVATKAVNNYFVMTGSGKIVLPTATSTAGNVVIQPGH